MVDKWLVNIFQQSHRRIVRVPDLADHCPDGLLDYSRLAVEKEAFDGVEVILHRLMLGLEGVFLMLDDLQ